MNALPATLPGPDYHDPAVYALDREAIFFRSWICVGRTEDVREAGQWITADVAGESILVTRDQEDSLRAFYNVCRHRGSRLCDGDSGQVKSAFRCPYHAWTYTLDGKLRGTPHVGREEVSREDHGLWTVAVDEWQGFVFVNLRRDDPPALRDALAESEGVLDLERFDLSGLRRGFRSVHEVQANWKIIVANYNECLHCPTVHPELVDIVPAFRSGVVFEDGRSDGGVSLAEGRRSVAGDHESRHLLLPGMTEEEASSYFGSLLFPAMFLDISGCEAIATLVQPTGPTSCRLITDYLFHPDSVARADFDPSAVVEFNERVAEQDNAVCERAQKGVMSRAFTHGVYPEKDAEVYKFDLHYKSLRDAYRSRSQEAAESRCSG
ncbi:(2Fe-2S)-binding protein [Streptomyces kronopolitis]|uniref:(2Fe-2S)-binding protein n=1 Tax=Streptomyces kronopolitis TaxID=1612435 RepID=A0ABQ2J1V6_9ACTN|nr:aromatic ring-hydroxylating dioxygenase subunit alpha [Streptomyces kronopolitis]GGN34796.1 (2Fe-2S)-binding protein [Streptomyces kronopolitis]